MFNQDNRPAPYIGDAEARKALPPWLLRVLLAVAILTDLLAVGLGLSMENPIPFAILLPLLFGQSAVLGFLETRSKQARYTKYTNGVVADTVRKPVGRHYFDFPVIEYEVDHCVYRIVGNRGESHYTIGSEIWVYFDPTDPRSAIQEFTHNHRAFPILGGILWGLGGFLLTAAAWSHFLG